MIAERWDILDENGTPASYAQLPVRFTLEGDAALVGPDVVTAEGGMCGTYLRTVGSGGKAVLTVSTDGLEPIRIHFTIFRKEVPQWN